jgi:hypothetical protein
MVLGMYVQHVLSLSGLGQQRSYHHLNFHPAAEFKNRVGSRLI